MCHHHDDDSAYDDHHHDEGDNNNDDHNDYDHDPADHDDHDDHHDGAIHVADGGGRHRQLCRGFPGTGVGTVLAGLVGLFVLTLEASASPRLARASRQSEAGLAPSLTREGAGRWGRVCCRQGT